MFEDIIVAMCGGFSLHNLTDSRMDKLVGHDKNIKFEPNYNARPGQSLPIVIYDGEKPRQKLMVWGIEFTFGGKPKLIFNSKVENLSSPFWRRMKPAIVPANGFYEWHKVGGKSVPHYFKDKDRGLMFLAGLYANDRFTIITIDARGVVELVHTRMPLIIKPGDEHKWLEGEIVDPYDNLTSYRVSDEVNNARINKEELIYPINP